MLGYALTNRDVLSERQRQMTTSMCNLPMERERAKKMKRKERKKGIKLTKVN